MKRSVHALGLLAALACGPVPGSSGEDPFADSDPATASDTDTDTFVPATYMLGGRGLKGPFLAGSSITVYELDGSLTQTGRSWSATTTDDYGSWSVGSIQLNSPYVDIMLSGYFFDEFSGNTSIGPLTLRSFHDVRQGTVIPINVATAIESERIRGLVLGGASFAAAATQGHRELVASLGLRAPIGAAWQSSPVDGSDDGQQLLFLSLALWADARGDVGALGQSVQHWASELASQGALSEATVAETVGPPLARFAGNVAWYPGWAEAPGGALNVRLCDAVANLTDALAGDGVTGTVQAPFDAIADVARRCPGGHVTCLGQCYLGTPDATPHAWGSGLEPNCREYACSAYPDVLQACQALPAGPPWGMLSSLCDTPDGYPTAYARWIGAAYEEEFQFADASTCDGCSVLERQRQYIEATAADLSASGLIGPVGPWSYTPKLGLHPADDPDYWTAVRAWIRGIMPNVTAQPFATTDLDGPEDLCTPASRIGDGTCDPLAYSEGGLPDGGDCLPIVGHPTFPSVCP